MKSKAFASHLKKKIDSLTTGRWVLVAATPAWKAKWKLPFPLLIRRPVRGAVFHPLATQLALASGKWLFRKPACSVRVQHRNSFYLAFMRTRVALICSFGGFFSRFSSRHKRIIFKIFESSNPSRTLFIYEYFKLLRRDAENIKKIPYFQCSMCHECFLKIRDRNSQKYWRYRLLFGIFFCNQ